MKPRLHRNIATLGIAAALPLAASGCAAGFDAQTAQPYAAGAGAVGESGDMLVRGATVVAAPAAGDAASFVGTVVNSGSRDDAVTGVEIEGDGQALLPRQGIAMPAGGATAIGTSPEGPTAVIEGLGDQARPGDFVEVTLRFRDAAPLTLDILVQAPEGPYATLTPTSAPTSATPTPGATASPTGS